MARSVCFTSCNNAYLDRASVLAHSFKAHHKDWDFIILLSDEVDDLQTLQQKIPEIDEAFPISNLDIAEATWTFKHDVEELCTAVKPFFSQHLIQRGYQRILFLDPDVVVLRRLHEVFNGLEEAPFLLTPHIWAPSGNRRHIEINEISCLAHGIFNLGFFALRACSDATDILDFWTDRVRTYCYRDHGSGLFTDQKWVNFFPVFFESTRILRNRTLNISSWNLVNVQMLGGMPELYVSGERVGFIHFSGLNHDVFSWAASEVGQLSNSVISAFQWYKAAVKQAAGAGFPASTKYTTYTSGRVVRKSHRVHYRSSPDFTQIYPNPYDDLSDNGFYAKEIEPIEEQLNHRHENPNFIVRRY